MTHTIKWTDVMGNLHYIHNKEGSIRLVLFNGTSMHLSNIDHRRTEELRMALSSCGSAEEMANVMRRYGQHNVEVVTPTPKPEKPVVDDASAAEALWSREGGSSIAPLIRTLANYGTPDNASREMEAMVTKAGEAVGPDWESAARAAGWTYETARFTGAGWFKRSGSNLVDYEGWQDLCENEGIDADEPVSRDQFIVSEWLADQLADKGEKVEKDFGGLTVWLKKTDEPVLDHPAILEIAADYDPEAEMAPAPRPFR